jgi:hypothetical protein
LEIWYPKSDQPEQSSVTMANMAEQDGTDAFPPENLLLSIRFVSRLRATRLIEWTVARTIGFCRDFAAQVSVISV